MDVTKDTYEEDTVIQFLRQEVASGKLENSVPEIAKGANMSYNQAGKVVERLRTRGNIGYRDRGSDKKSTRYYYPGDIVKLCKQAWNL